MNEEQIRDRAQELYLEWCNSPDARVADVIAKGMLEVVTAQTVVELKPTGDIYQDQHQYAKLQPDGTLEYVPDELVVSGEIAQDIRGLASAFVLTEEMTLVHLLSLGKMAAVADLYIKDADGNYVALGDIT